MALHGGTRTRGGRRNDPCDLRASRGSGSGRLSFAMVGGGPRDIFRGLRSNRKNRRVLLSVRARPCPRAAPAAGSGDEQLARPSSPGSDSERAASAVSPSLAERIGG